MNLFDLGGQLLRVGKAVTPPENIAAAPTAATLTQITGTNSLANASLASQMQDIDKALNSINAANALTQAAQAQVLVTAAATATASTTSTTTTTPATAVSTATASSQLVTQTSTSSLQSPTTQALEVQTTKVLDVTTSVSSQKSPSVAGITNTLNEIKTASPSTAPVTSLSSSSSSNQNQFEIELTENQKKLLGMTSADDPSASLEQQVDITLKGKEQRMILMQKLMQRRQPASRILVLRNMVGPEDVDEDLENEITDECGKFGEVERVIIYQEKQGEEEDADVIVKIFVEFTNAKSLEKATESLNGRFFAGRIVKAEVYDQTSYDSKDYSG